MYVSVSGLFVFDFWFVSCCHQTIISSNSNNSTVARAPVVILAHERTLGIKATLSKATGWEGWVADTAPPDQHPLLTST